MQHIKSQNFNEGEYVEDQGVDGSMILIWIVWMCAIAKDRGRWWAYVYMVMILQALQKAQNSLTI
jgi:hypothetical protein